MVSTASTQSRANGKRNGRPRTWTREMIIVALHRDAARRGRPPTSAEWRRQGPGRPGESTVRNRFGNWNAAIEAAALEPRAPGRLKQKLCKRGHPLDEPANVYINSHGRRECRTCIRARRRRG